MHRRDFLRTVLVGGASATLVSTLTAPRGLGHPSKWAFHCHHLYHRVSGMMAMLTYGGVA